MKKPHLLTLTLLLITTTLSAQTKVANYAIGKYGTDRYEHFEFWTKDGKKTEITYSYGKNDKNVTLQYAGKDETGNSFIVASSCDLLIYSR